MAYPAYVITYDPSDERLSGRARWKARRKVENEVSQVKRRIYKSHRVIGPKIFMN